VLGKRGKKKEEKKGAAYKRGEERKATFSPTARRRKRGRERREKGTPFTVTPSFHLAYGLRGGKREGKEPKILRLGGGKKEKVLPVNFYGVDIKGRVEE